MENQNYFDTGTEVEKSRLTKPSPGNTNPQPSRKRKSKLPLIIGIGLVGFVVAGLIGLAIANAILDGQYKDKIEPGVSISGVYVGEMNRAEARAALDKQVASFVNQPVLLQFQDKKWQPNLEQLGAEFNFDASLDMAFGFGKNGDFIKDSRLYKLMSPETHNVPLELMVNEAKLRGYLSDISDRIRRDPIEPNVQLNGAQVVLTEGKIGFNVDYNRTLEDIKKSLGTLKSNDQNLLQVGDVSPIITPQEFTDFKDKLTALVATPVTIKFKDKNWTLDQNQLAAMIKVTRSTRATDTKHFSYSFDKKPVETFVKGLTSSINQEAKTAVIGWENGKVVAKVASLDGQQLVVDRSIDEIVKQILDPSGSTRTAELVVDVKEPEISSNNLDKLGIKEVIGEGISSFVGSAYERSTNIKVGAGYLNGKFIRPHTVFSFLDSIGLISQSRGYVNGYAIIADQTVPDVGGGICQVSTTTFRAAFFAGLPIVERNAHAYRVSWYEEMGEPVGFDAAVYQPGVDMKFENNTDFWMYLEAQVINGKLYVRLYGTKTPGQTVDLVSAGISKVTPPLPDRIEVDKSLLPGQKKQVDYARKGLTTNITRVVKVNGTEVKRDEFPTRFQSWPNIIKVGPAPTPDPNATTAAPDPNATPAPAGTPAPGGNNAPPTTAAPPPPAPTTKS